ncbi:Hypothetical protein Deide_11051 [Deinococcus deserti VCD115]|uniref:Uncharacterized protein n=1 Tax=Deinococcus deserti (strain DSM 17065 / CIP 109153 / LMG 22923 / VCD115) TaxID=546414 RepID=C1CUY5_DEIDV|nr:Hypothetical protein Deide_11051 [Deinococcus deserti VCD115]
MRRKRTAGQEALRAHYACILQGFPKMLLASGFKGSLVLAPAECGCFGRLPLATELICLALLTLYGRLICFSNTKADHFKNCVHQNSVRLRKLSVTTAIPGVTRYAGASGLLICSPRQWSSADRGLSGCRV